MKCETNWEFIDEVVCLNSKCYSMLIKGEKQKLCSKGVKRNKHKLLKHNLYKMTAGIIPPSELTDGLVFEGDQIKGTQRGFQTNADHSIITKEITKIFLSNYNDKRFNDEVPYGYEGN